MPFEDDKPKDTENSMFEASSVLVAEAKIGFFLFDFLKSAYFNAD